METFIPTFNTIIGIGTILLEVCGVIILAQLLFFRKNKENALLSFTAKHAYTIGLFVALGAMALSLVYSEIIGFAPCILCWYQRIFMYPLAFLFAISLIKKERIVTDYALVLSFVGILIALYHNLLSWLPSANLPCSATGPSCTMLYTNIFGYITIPVMSLSGFILVFLVLLVHKMWQRNVQA